jgi:hypothetical protein
MVAARERFPSRTITEADGDHWLMALGPIPPALHLTHQRNLDVLGLDDRVSTGRIVTSGRVDPDLLLETCGFLADAIYDWWHGQPPPLLYRSRTMPAVGRSVAFTGSSSVPTDSIGRLRDARALHAHLVLRARFTVPPDWIA